MRDETDLPHELRSLIHHVQLHETGWWDRALERIIMAIVWTRGPLTIEALDDHLRSTLDRRVPLDRIEQIVAVGLASGALVENADAELRVAQEHAAVFTQELKEVNSSEQRVKERLIDVVAAESVDGDPEELWEDFERLYLQPLVHEAGARMYDVVTASSDVAAAVPSYAQIVEPLTKKYGDGVRKALVEFLDPEDLDVRAYILRALNSEFVREAAGLSGDTIGRLQASQGRPNRVRVFLDTNFLFSFLELHDNPSNDVAHDLIKLIEQVSGTLSVQLYVLPITVEETRRVLREVMSKLEGTVPRGTLAAAARRLTSTGLVTRYLEEAASFDSGQLRPDDFFGPYESNLVPILRERGVELYNTDLDALRMDQSVIDDLHRQTEVQERVRKRGAKSYESNLHDMVLWHFARGQRPAVVEAPLDAGSWVCTVDYGLIAFDRHKRRGRSSAPPVCLTPSSLIQMLQFWSPRSDALDRAVAGAIREPLLFLGFDAASEQTTLRILRTISRYEGIGDLSEETIFNVLTNDALRARLATGSTLAVGDEDEYVQAAVVEETRRLEQQLEVERGERDARLLELKDGIRRTEGELQDAATENSQLRSSINQRDEDIERLRGELDAVTRDLEKERAERSLESQQHQSETSEVSGRLQALEHRAERATQLRRVLLVLCGVVPTAVVAAVLLARELGDALRVPALAWGGTGIAAALVVFLVADQILRRAPLLQGTGLHRWVVGARRSVVGFLAAILASVVAAVVLFEFTAPNDVDELQQETDDVVGTDDD